MKPQSLQPVALSLLLAVGLAAGCAGGPRPEPPPPALDPVAAARPLIDPGPVWQGLTDEAALRLRVDRHLADAERLLGEVRAVRGRRTAGNTFVPYKAAEHALASARWLAMFARNAHPEAAFRAAAQASETRIAERIAALALDRTLYDALAAVDVAAEPGMRHMIERQLAAYRRDGMDRDPATRERIVALRSRIAELGTEFQRNLTEDVKTIRVAPDSLAGLPADWIAANVTEPPAEDGRLALRLTPANYVPLITFADSESLRSEAARLYLTRGHPANAPVVDELRELRHELAGLLGYPSWAHYALEPTMAASPERVSRFLEEVAGTSEAAARRELATLLAVRRLEEPEAATVPVVDWRYWKNRHRRRAYGADEQAMRAYLPYARVRDGILGAYARMFGIELRPAPGTPVWSEAVEPYEVWEDGALVGRFYLDMHPREGKAGQFATYYLRSGGGQLPELAILCNFPGGAEGDPGLLTPGHVSTFFHEFGHLANGLFMSRSPVLGLLDDIETDFLEAPSRLFEAWARDPAVLRRFARHHETGRPIPAELVEAYDRADRFGRALDARTGLWYSALSLDLFDDPPAADPTAQVERRAAAYLPGGMPDWLHPSSQLDLLVSLSSNFYTYLWSEVIAQDLLTGFDRADLLDPEEGRRYRELILARTGSAPAASLVERFLGRPFTAEAWRAGLEEE